MGPIGKNSDLVNLLHAKTKIKKADIVDLLKALPPSMAEAFIMANPEEGKRVDLGGIAISWQSGGMWGSRITAKISDTFKLHLSRLKVEKKYPLAEKLYELMHPINRESALKRCKSTA